MKKLVAVAVIFMAVLAVVLPARAGEFQFPSPEKQIELWKEANQGGNLGISKGEFASIPKAPPLIPKHYSYFAYSFVALFYGFGDDGYGNADVLVSGQISFDYFGKMFDGIGGDRFIKFKEGYMRLRPGAWRRPKGFYWARVRFGGFGYSVVRTLDNITSEETGSAYEAFQLAGILMPEYMIRMASEQESEMYSWYLADYECSHHGDSNFRSSWKDVSSRGFVVELSYDMTRPGFKLWPHHSDDYDNDVSLGTVILQPVMK